MRDLFPETTEADRAPRAGAREILAASGRHATISDCGAFRYTLSRWWGRAPGLLFVMLNPSTADASIDDPTIRRCATFAFAHGFGALTVVNLFAYRATDPRDLQRAGWPVGPDADEWIEREAKVAADVCVAWGAIGDKGPAVDRVQVVMPMLRRAGHVPKCLRMTRSGHPQHPLYLPSTSRLIPYSIEAIEAAQEARRP